MKDYWNDPPEEPEAPTCPDCGIYLDDAGTEPCTLTAPDGGTYDTFVTLLKCPECGRAVEVPADICPGPPDDGPTEEEMNEYYASLEAQRREQESED